MPSPRELPPADAFALWNLGFRPFYLLAGIWAALAVPVWSAQYAGWLPQGAYLQGAVWHGHEMVFGYTLAVIAGFLLTAVRNWTNLPTPSGAPLAALAALWVAGRVLVLTPWGLAAALACAAFPVAVAVAIGRPLVQARSQRNYFFAGLLLLLACAVLAVHLAWQGVLPLPPRAGLVAGLDVVLFIMVVMGGRVIPMFTANGVPGSQPRRLPWLEKAAPGSVLALLAVDVTGAPAALVAAVALACALAQALRLALWQPGRTFGTPLVWILHVSYGWIVVHLLLRALGAAGLVPESLALHALTLGGIGGLTLGMMTRTARGHTGRPLAADRAEVAAYLLVQAAALVRVMGGALLPGAYGATVLGSALLWSAAFALFTASYWPILSKPRLDGRPG